MICEREEMMNSELEPKSMLSLHSILPRSRANGPGVRFVVWFQGCTRNCPGCFNPKTHTRPARENISVEALCEQILVESDFIQGVTISGGEPFEQAEGLAELVRAIRLKSDISILVFSGYTLGEIRKIPSGTSVLENIDVLIAGPYNRTQHLGHHLLGSANQQMCLLTGRYTEADIVQVPRSEVVLSVDGDIHLSGVAPITFPVATV